MTLERDVIPGAHVERVQMIDCGEGVEFVQGRCDAAVFEIRKPTDVYDEFGAAPVRSQIVTGALDVAVGQSETLARPTKPQAGG
jgi:hypothetical protein